MQAINYYELLKYHAQQHGDKLLFEFDRIPRTYGEQLSRARRMSEHLHLRRGSLVGISLPGLPAQLTAFFAVQAAGAIPVILHPSIAGPQLRELCDINRISWVLNSQGAYAAGWGTHPEKACVGALTSGSTGLPKVLLRSYGSWADFFPVQNQVFQFTGSSSLLMSGSLSFTGNLNAFLSVLYAGGTVYGTMKVQPKRWRELIEAKKLTHIYLVPSKLRLLGELDAPPSFGVRMVYTGSQLLFDSPARRLRDKFPNAEILLYYGASELNYITYIRYEEILKKPLSVGRPFPGVRVDVGKDGLIYVDTPYRVLDFSNPGTVGDAGRIDQDGDLIFEGRCGVVNRSGLKISLSKVERALLKLDGVDYAAVLPYKDEKRGEEVAAFFTGRIQENAVKQGLKNSLAREELPRRIMRLEEIPLGSTGKPDQTRLLTYLEDN